jgi:NLI interacting factor-like phosphatase
MMKDLPQPSATPTIEELNRIVHERQKLLQQLSKELHTALEYSPNPIDPPPSEEGYLKHLMYLQKVDYHFLLKTQLKNIVPHNRRLVILDLDDTLIHLYNPAKEKEIAFFAKLNGVELLPLEPPEGLEYQGCIFCQRPGLESFIRQLQDWDLDLAIYSTATLPYIHAMLDLASIDADRFVKIWHREHCVRERGQALFKTIEWALVEGYQRGHILVVDDAPNYRSLFPHEEEVASQHFNTLTVTSYQGQPDKTLCNTLKRIKILKDLDIVVQRQKEEDAWQRWGENAKSYETGINKGLRVFIHDEVNGLKPNPNYKRYPVPAPKPIDHFDEE